MEKPLPYNNSLTFNLTKLLLENYITSIGYTQHVCNGFLVAYISKMGGSSQVVPWVAIQPQTLAVHIVETRRRSFVVRQLDSSTAQTYIHTYRAPYARSMNTPKSI